MASELFTIDVPQAALDDLNERLDDTRWPDEIPGSGWDYGSNLAYIQELVAYWRTRFDWRAQERLLNSMPQFKADVDPEITEIIEALMLLFVATPILVRWVLPRRDTSEISVGAHWGDA